MVVTAGVGAAGGQADGDVTVAGARLTGRASPRCRILKGDGGETSNTQETLQIQEETNQTHKNQRSHQRSKTRPEITSESRPEITSEIKEQTRDHIRDQRAD